MNTSFPPSRTSWRGCTGHYSGGSTRREMLKHSCNGFGMLALSALMTEKSYGAHQSLQVPHHRPAAKNVIFLFQDGGVSHVDSFDPKPKLTELDGEKIEIDNRENGAYFGERIWLGSPWKFQRHGESGLPVSELFPHIASCIDDIAVIRSTKSDFPLHSRGNLLLHTGSNSAGSPSLGSWVNYGLGSENENLPGFVVLHSGFNVASGLENFSHGALPAKYHATLAQTEGVPIENITPASQTAGVQRAKLDLLGNVDRQFSTTQGSVDSIDSAINNYELAYRMQSLVPDVVDLSSETAATQKLYGIDSTHEPKKNYGIECLRARRLIESGVRFVEVLCPNIQGPTGTWDQHGNLKRDHEHNASNTDQAIAGLINDLKARGLFDETLIVWAGEFGRTPHRSAPDSRDHHPTGFTVWLTGGGIKGGTIHGATDELGMHAVEDIVSIHDLHATILHLLGLDHERLTFRSGGRDLRLTEVYGNVIDNIIT